MTIEDVGGKLGSRDMFVRATTSMAQRTRDYVRQWTRHRVNHKIQQNDTLKVRCPLSPPIMKARVKP